MEIYYTGTMHFYGRYRSDGLHMIHEIDDDEMGYKSAIEYVVAPEAVTKLFSLIGKDEFIKICREGGTSGLEEFLASNDIPYRND